MNHDTATLTELWEALAEMLEGLRKPCARYGGGSLRRPRKHPSECLCHGTAWVPVAPSMEKLLAEIDRMVAATRVVFWLWQAPQHCQIQNLHGVMLTEGYGATKLEALCRAAAKALER